MTNNSSEYNKNSDSAFNQNMTDPNTPEENEPEIYHDEHELGHTPRDMDEVEPDRYLEASYEDRYDIGDSYEF
jgi:hypothetical protein